MFEFVMFVLGAVFGVVLDRLYTYGVEKRHYVSISPSFSQHVAKGRAFNLKITNEGFGPLPPYEVWLSNPHTGSFAFFEHKEKTARLPHQTDVFTVWESHLSEHTDGLLSFLTKEKGTGVPSRTAANAGNLDHDLTEEQSQKWVLRLIICGSDDEILYESRQAGVSLAHFFVECLRQGTIFLPGFPCPSCNVTNSPWAKVKQWRERRRLIRDSKREGKGQRKWTAASDKNARKSEQN